MGSQYICYRQIRMMDMCGNSDRKAVVDGKDLMYTSVKNRAEVPQCVCDGLKGRKVGSLSRGWRPRY